MAAILTSIRAMLLAASTIAFVVACLFFEGSPLTRGIFIKAIPFYRLFIFGLSAVLFAVWYYVYDLSNRIASKPPGDKKKALPHDDEL